MVDVFIENFLLLLFVVVGLGYGVGSIWICGSNFGVVVVLFVGFGVGGFSLEFYILDIIIFLGLAMFVYMIGLSSGLSFFVMFW